MSHVLNGKFGTAKCISGLFSPENQISTHNSLGFSLILKIDFSYQFSIIESLSQYVYECISFSDIDSLWKFSRDHAQMFERLHTQHTSKSF